MTWPALVLLVHGALSTLPATPATSYVERVAPAEYRAYVRCSERATRDLLGDVPPLTDRARAAEHMERMRELADEVQQRCADLLPAGAGFDAGPVDVIVG